MGRLIIVMFEFDFIVFMQLFIGLGNILRTYNITISCKKL
jgi:hypothetical protein